MLALQIAPPGAQDEYQTVQRMLAELHDLFARLDTLHDKSLRNSKLREITAKLNETKTCVMRVHRGVGTSACCTINPPPFCHRAIRQWESAAKAARLDQDDVAATKKQLVGEINAYIQRKQDAGQETGVRHAAMRQAAKEEPTEAGGWVLLWVWWVCAFVSIGSGTCDCGILGGCVY